MNLSSAQFRRAAALQEKIEAMQAELASLLGSGPAASGKGKKDKEKAHNVCLGSQAHRRSTESPLGQAEGRDRRF